AGPGPQPRSLSVKGSGGVAPPGATWMPLPSSDPNTPVEGPPPPLDLDDAYRAHAARVARWVGHLGGPSADVDDLVHEIFLVADRRLSDFGGDAKLTTWLYRITERVVRGRRRNERIRRWLAQVRRADV